MTIWRVFGPEYGGDVVIIGFKVWSLLEIKKGNDTKIRKEK